LNSSASAIIWARSSFSFCSFFSSSIAFFLRKLLKKQAKTN